MTQESGQVEVDDKDGCRWLTLNRPHRLNAFDQAQWTSLLKEVQIAQSDESVKAIVITGGRDFSTGYDLSEALEATYSEAGPASPDVFHAAIRVGNETCWAVWNSEKPVVAAVRGYCLGGAFELTMACDFVLCDDTAMFGEPEIRLSDAPPFLISPWVMSMRRVKDLLLTGDVIDSSRAQEWGIVTARVAPDDLCDEVQKLGRKLSGFPNDIWSVNKRAINRTYEVMGFKSAIEMGADQFAIVNSIQTEVKEGMFTRIKADGIGAALKWAQGRYS